jgi:hypothetical protein
MKEAKLLSSQGIEQYIPKTKKILKLVKKLNNEILNIAESLFGEEKYFEAVSYRYLTFLYFLFCNHNIWKLIFLRLFT